MNFAIVLQIYNDVHCNFIRGCSESFSKKSTIYFYWCLQIKLLKCTQLYVYIVSGFWILTEQNYESTGTTIKHTFPTFKYSLCPARCSISTGIYRLVRGPKKQRSCSSGLCIRSAFVTVDKSKTIIFHKELYRHKRYSFLKRLSNRIFVTIPDTATICHEVNNMFNRVFRNVQILWVWKINKNHVHSNTSSNSCDDNNN